jgi:DNA polymerase I-like protein with 3'-5' exonuclease and polymerase domains
MDKTAEATERFRQRFPIMEGWRLGIINQMTRFGWVELPDGHRRYRQEATDRWLEAFLEKWPNEDPGARRVLFRIAQKIQKRAHNQGVNAVVQGTCATIAKRSILQVGRRCRDLGWGPDKVRFLIPIHDELVWSVHRSIAADFVAVARDAMITHPDLFTRMAVDASPAIGLSFEPWQASKVPLGQVELFEPPAEIVGPKLANTRLDKAGIELVINHLMEKRRDLAAAA